MRQLNLSRRETSLFSSFRDWISSRFVRVAIGSAAVCLSRWETAHLCGSSSEKGVMLSSSTDQPCFEFRTTGDGLRSLISSLSAGPVLRRQCGPRPKSADESDCDVVWCGVMWCGVVWCGVVWCVEPFTGQNSETHSTPPRSAGSISIHRYPDFSVENSPCPPKSIFG